MDGAEDVEPARSTGGTYDRRGEASLCAPLCSVVVHGAVGVPDACSAGGCRARASEDHQHRMEAPGVPQARPWRDRQRRWGVGGTGWSSCRQKLVQRSNRSGHDISSVISKELEVCRSTRTMVLSKREGCFIKDDVSGDDDPIR